MSGHRKFADLRHKGGPMSYRFRLYDLDGNDVGEARYSFQPRVDETIVTGDGRELRVVDVVPVYDDASPFIAFLQVEPAG